MVDLFIARALYRPGTVFARIFEAVGEAPSIIPFAFLAVVIVGLLLKRPFFVGRKKELLGYALFAIFAVVLSALLISLIKDFVGRSRYYTALGADYTPWYVRGGNGDSFPSGHAGMSVYAFLIPDFIKRFFNKKVIGLYILSGVFVFCVCLARMLDGAHYFSDILFGVLVGFASTALAKTLERAFSNARTTR